MNKLLTLLTAVMLLLMIACTTDTYEPGDGEFSYLKSDFGVAKSNAEKLLVEFTTDDNRSFKFSQPIEQKWVTTADSIYRVQVYYDANCTEYMMPKGLGPVSVIRPKPLKKGEEMKMDPVGWTSLWVSENKEYINLGLSLMVGSMDEQAVPQVIGVVLDKTTPSPDGHKHYQITFYHDQKNVPQYYTQETFASIPTEGFDKGDVVNLSVNTYSGLKTKEITIE